jgi:hypothetical protein
MWITCTLLGASVLVLVPAHAQACSCVPIGLFGVVMPQEGDRVPSNARIWVAGYEVDSFEVLAPDGSSIAFDSSEIVLDVGGYPPNGAGVHVLTPRQPLAPGEGYRAGLRGFADFVTFDVDDTLDRQAPPAPEVVNIDALVMDDEGNSCGKSRGAGIHLKGEGLVFVWHASEQGPEGDPPAGHAIQGEPAVTGTAFFGYGTACSADWPGDEILHLRFASFDVAGNRSEESPEITIDRPEYDASLCSVSDVAPRARARLFVLLSVFAGVFVRVRMRRSAPR